MAAGNGVGGWVDGWVGGWAAGRCGVRVQGTERLAAEVTAAGGEGLRMGIRAHIMPCVCGSGCRALSEPVSMATAHV